MELRTISVGNNLDNDGKFDEEGSFGLCTNYHALRLFFTSWGVEFTTKTSDGTRELDLKNPKNIDAYEKLYDFIHDSNVAFYKKDYTPAMEVGLPMFMEDRTLFWTQDLSAAALIRNMTSDYGIIPFPKYDENQENYKTAVRDDQSAILVPISVTDTEFVGTIVEALCMEGYKTVVPAYYERSLKARDLRDPVAWEMLDLIRDSVTYDFAMIYTVPLNYTYSIYGSNIRAENRNIISFIDKNIDTYQNALDQMYDDYFALKEQ